MSGSEAAKGVAQAMAELMESLAPMTEAVLGMRKVWIEAGITSEAADQMAATLYSEMTKMAFTQITAGAVKASGGRS